MSELSLIKRHDNTHTHSVCYIWQIPYCAKNFLEEIVDNFRGKVLHIQKFYVCACKSHKLYLSDTEATT